MPGDLVGGRYPLTQSLNKALGLASNATQSNLAVRTNVDWFGLNVLADQAAALVSGEMTIVPVPVEVGDVISKVTIAAGGTPESGGSHAWAAVYSGVATTAVLLGAQSADVTGAAAIGASASYTFTLATPVLVTPANAPDGYLYVGVSVTGTVPSLSCVGGVVATACQYARFSGGVPFLAGTIGSTLAGTAPTTVTLGSVTATTKVPEIYLS